MIDFIDDVCAPIGFLVLLGMALIFICAIYAIIRNKIRKVIHARRLSRRPRFECRKWEDDLTCATDYEIWVKWGKRDWQKLRDGDGTRIAFGDYWIAHHLVYILNNLPCCTSGYRSMLQPQTEKNNINDPEKE